MRYKLDQFGYVSAVSFGCYLNNCAEYTGEVPAGYSTLEEWADNAYINAYYISNGILTLDSEKLSRIKSQEEIDKVENAPLIRKDLFESEETLKKQYKKATVTGKVITLSDINTLSPSVKITGVNPLNYPVLSVYTQGENLLPCDAKTEKISGVTFTALGDGGIKTLGTAQEDIEYTIAGSPTNTVPLFVLKANESYYFSDTSGFGVEFRYFDGETTYQQYVKETSASGVIKLDHDVKVTHVVRKMPKGLGYGGNVYYPRLNFGTTPLADFEPHKRKVLDIDFTEVLKQFPYSPTFGDLYIENGAVTLNINGVDYVIGGGYVGLFEDFNTIYATEDVTLEVTYSTNEIDVDNLAFLQGKATTTNKFKILTDGSIEAHNGFFSGQVNADTGKIGRWQFSTNNFVGYLADGKTSGFVFNYNASQNRFYIDCNYNIEAGNQVTGKYLYAWKDATVDGKLTVNDELWAYDDLYAEKNIACSGTVYASAFSDASKAELKKNFEKLNSGLDIINEIDIYKYNLKTENDEDKKHIGLVIGDKYRYSEAVTSRKNEGADLYSLISVCVKAIQEQQEQINQLKEELEKLK
jgi:hypothetical protein